MRKFLAVFIIIFISCTKGVETPEGLLIQYVEDVTTKSLTRDYFEKYTTDKLLEKINSMDDEELKSFSQLNKVKNPKIEIINKNCKSQTECSLTYILKYDYIGEDKSKYKSEVKKVALISQVEGIWKISEVSNLKTFINSNQPLEVLK